MWKYVKNEGKKGQFGQIIVLKSQKKTLITTYKLTGPVGK